MMRTSSPMAELGRSSAILCTFFVVNNPLKEGSGFGSDRNLVTFLHRTGQTQRLPLAAIEID